MKRIIGGVTYNTATASRITDTLWQTPGGAYFLLEVDPVEGAASFRPVSTAVAREHKGTPLYQDYGERRITLRLPAQLYRRVTVAADRANQSRSTYITRILERLLMEDGT